MYYSLINSMNRVLSSTDFIMTIDTTKAGSASNTFILLAGNIGTYNAIIDWGDSTTSTITTYNDAYLTHVYSASGVYTVKISGIFPYIRFANTGDKLKLMSIEKWGNCGFTSLDSSFYGCSNLVINATDYLTNNITSIYRAFSNCSSITTFPNFNKFNTSSVTDSRLCFSSTSALTSLDMSDMDFSSCSNFGEVGANGMFHSYAIRSGIQTINLTNITLNTSSFTFSAVFHSCSSLTTIIGFNTLDFSNCTDFSFAFYNCTSLNNANLTNLDFSNCTTFYRTFFTNTSWTTLDISNWTLNSISNINMNETFRLCGTRNIVGLDTWNIEKVNNFVSFMTSSKITTVEYDKLLISWDGQDAVNSLAVNFGTSQYTLASASATARAGLIANDLWTITDGGGI